MYKQIAQSALQRTYATRILQAFALKGIPVIVLKGLALLDRIYPQRDQRKMGDIDLLVRRSDWTLSSAILDAEGYHVDQVGLDWTPNFAKEFMGEVPYRKGSVVIDLHWHLVVMQWYRHATAFDLEGIWSRAVPTTLDGMPALRLCPEDELIHLCYHTALHHGLAHQQGSKDIARVARTEIRSLNWPTLARRARAWRVSVACWAALRVARELDSEAIPQASLDALQVPRWRQTLLYLFIERARSGQQALVSGRMRFLGLLLVDRLRDLPTVICRGLFPSRRWIETRFGLSPRAARWRQVTYPLEVLARGCQAVWRALRPGMRQRLVKE